MRGRTLRAGGRAAALFLIVCSGCGDGGHRAGPTQDEPRPDAGTDAAQGGSAAPDADLTDRDAGDGGSQAGGGDHDAAMHDAAPDGAAEDRDPPELVASTPQDGDDNVAFELAPVLVFSEPVTLGKNAIRIRQKAPARTLALTTTPSADGRSIEITLEDPPDVPAELTIEIGAGVTDRAGNPLEPVAVHYALPIWLRLGAALNRDPDVAASDVRIAIDGEGEPVVLTAEDGHVYASRWHDDDWQSLGAALDPSGTLASPGAEPRFALAMDADGAPIAAFRESSGVRVLRWDGADWQTLGGAADADANGSYAPALALGAGGEPIVAFDSLDANDKPVLRVRSLASASWQTLADVAVEARGVRLAGDGQGAFTLAYQEVATGVHALRWDGSVLQPLGSGPALDAVSGSFALSVASTQACALTAQGEGTASWDSGTWSALPQDLGFNDSSAALDRTLAHAPDATLFAAFSETPLGESAARVYVQRLSGERFQPLGPPANRSRMARATRPSLVITAQGEPLVAWLETPVGGGAAQVFVSRFNGDPAQPPIGLQARAYDPECLATAPVDGSLLTDTMCFSDATGRKPVAGFIPFDVRSPLWSDGAFKRRFFMLPEGKSITYRDPGIWTFPEGSILIKEFAIEAKRGDPSTIRPVETRFLIVRDTGNWDRYSYQWNQDATQAVLRPEAPATPLVDFDIEDENGLAAVQTHFNPNRAQCLSCHEGSGTVLGLQTAMINRNFDYGTTVDNQLRTMQQLGIFGSSFTDDDLAVARFMPTPSDTTYSTEVRLRAYLHANCAGCHHPLQGMDLRIQIATLDSGLCTKIAKGSLDGSTIYWRDVQRGYPGGTPGAAPMPPLGTLVANPLLEPLLTDWILDPQNPCP